MKGIVKIFSENPEQTFELICQPGDYFGEAALLNSTLNKRTATVMAETDLALLVVEKHDFWFVFGNGEPEGGSHIIQKLLNLSSSRKSNPFQAISKNSVLNQLSNSQKTHLEIILREKKFRRNQILWKAGGQAMEAIIIRKGEVSLGIQRQKEVKK